ncbi:uncharacterized protein N7473_004449 [Penicillium subrubescens]|uniref:uncharacterized protein n=1 Tax=Penicillium subrubescens TaxID=1316194 RepID=UPI002545B48A|nr:uncharacterized protein N7473_004449 [Penicillium subrubescens]KAJ5900379.1 hypothetical protein N7473_004449 [Penicillium subrubescens]
MTLVDIDNTGLNDAELVEKGTEVSLRGDATDEEGAAQNLDVTRADGIVPLDELGARRGEIMVCPQRGMRQALPVWRATFTVFVTLTTSSIARITLAPSGITVILVVHRPIVAARRRGRVTSVSTGKVRRTAVPSGRRARVVTIPPASTIDTVLHVRVALATRALAGYRAKSRKLSGAASTYGIGYVDELQGRSPLVLRDALLRQ